MRIFVLAFIVWSMAWVLDDHRSRERARALGTVRTDFRVIPEGNIRDTPEGDTRVQII